MLTALLLASVAVLPEPPAPEANTMQPVWSRRVHMPAASVAFSPDSRVVAFGHLDTGRIVLSEVSSGKTLHTLRQAEGERVEFIEFNSDGKVLETRTSNFTERFPTVAIRLWEVGTGKELFLKRVQCIYETFPMRPRVFSPDKKLLALSDGEFKIRLLDVGTGKEIRKLMGHESTVLSVQFSGDGSKLASFDEDEVILWDILAGKQHGRRKWRGRQVQGVHFDGERLLVAVAETATTRPSSTLWDFAENTRIIETPYLLAGIGLSGLTSLTVAPQGTKLASWTGFGLCRGGGLLLWDLKTATARCVVGGQIQHGPQPFFAANGRSLIAVWNPSSGGPSDRSQPGADIFAVPSGGHLHRIALPGGVNAAAISPDSKTVAVAGHQECLVQRLRLAPVRVVNLASGFISPNKQFRATVDADGKVRISDRVSGQTLHTLQDIKGPIKVVSFSPGGEYVAAASEGKVCLWTTGRGRLRHSWPALQGPIESLDFGPDGDTLEARTPMKVFRWDLRTGKELGELDR